MYSPTFSRLFVYLSVFLLLSSSVSAKPTRFTRDSGSSPVVKRTQKHDDINLARSAPSKNGAGTTARPKDTVADEGSLKNVVVGAAHPKIAYTKRVAVNAAQPKDAANANTKIPVVDAAQPKNVVVVNAPDPKDTSVNEAGLRDAAANAAPRVVVTPNANANPVANRNIPNVAAVVTTAGGNNPVRPNIDAVFPLNVDVPTSNVVASVANSVGINRLPAAPANVAATASSNQVSGFNLANAAGSELGAIVTSGGSASPNGAASLSTTPLSSTVNGPTGGLIATSSTPGNGPLINLPLGNFANRPSGAISSTNNIPNVFPGSTNVVGGPLVRLTSGTNAGSSPNTATVQVDATGQRNTNVTPVFPSISGANIPVTVGGGSSLGNNNNPSGGLSINAATQSSDTNDPSSILRLDGLVNNVLSGSIGLANAFGTTATSADKSDLRVSAMTS